MQSVPHGFINIPSWDILKNFIFVQIRRPFETELLRWDWISLLACLLLCVNPWVIPARWLSSFRFWFHRYAQHRSRAVWTCVLFPMIIRVALLPAAPVKPPSVQDEFSLLLLADTFRSGRLTNPTPPYWQHFETIHVIQKPTYTSMYPPGSSAFLALGALFHNPWLGLLLSVGLMCGAICWMLQAWTPPAWALGGALVAALQIGIGSYWVNTYLGAAPVPAMAGALLFGAMPRFLRKPTWSAAAIFALGVVLLVNTRPLEGSILSLICFGMAVFWRWKGALGNPVIRWPVLVPGSLLLLLGGMFTGYYSWRVTGNPLKMPYVVNRDTYGWPENLAFLPPKKITYRHPNLRNMHYLELYYRTRYLTLGRMVHSWCNRAALLWEFYVGPELTLPLLMLPWTLRSRKLRPLFYIVLFMLSLNTLQLMAYPQHVAPETAIFYALLVGGMRQIYVLARRRSIMPERVMASLVLSVACGAALSLFMERFHITPGNFWEHPSWPYGAARASILSKIEAMPGKHLVLVRYADYHTPHEEWVYNGADINKSKVIWANSMGFKDDMQLRKYFSDRQAWLVEPEKDRTGFLPLTRKTYAQSELAAP
jgi:hypothetical protein